MSLGHFRATIGLMASDKKRRQVSTTVKPIRCMKGSKFLVRCSRLGGSSSNNDHCRTSYGDNQGLWFRPTPCSWKVASDSKGQGRRLAMFGLLYHGKCSLIRLRPLTVSVVFECLSLPLHTGRYFLGMYWNANVLKRY